NFQRDVEITWGDMRR
nr:RecName: Full=30 kDa cell wall protein [Arabidopsis thaliana]